MFDLLRTNSQTKILADEEEFWDCLNSTQVFRNTLVGAESEKEERLDLEVGTRLKEILEKAIGPEEGVAQVQRQNWDWNDDRTRAVYVIKSAFNPQVIPEVKQLLTGPYSDFRVIVMLHENWDCDLWGGIVIMADTLAIQKNVAQAYVVAI